MNSLEGRQGIKLQKGDTVIEEYEKEMRELREAKGEGERRRRRDRGRKRRESATEEKLDERWIGI